MPRKFKQKPGRDDGFVLATKCVPQRRLLTWTLWHTIEGCWSQYISTHRHSDENNAQAKERVSEHLVCVPVRIVEILPKKERRKRR